MEGYIAAKNFRKLWVSLRHLWTSFWKKMSCGFENFKNAQNLDPHKAEIGTEISTPIFSKYFLRCFLASESLLDDFNRF